MNSLRFTYFRQFSNWLSLVDSEKFRKFAHLRISDFGHCLSDIHIRKVFSLFADVCKLPPCQIEFRDSRKHSPLKVAYLIHSIYAKG